jgi:hypothetical protein
MSDHTVHQMIGRALTDRQFREVLLHRPQEAVREFPFSNRERALIISLRAASLEEFARKLDEHLGDAGNGQRRGNGRRH